MDVTTALTLDPRQINSTDQFCKVQTEDVQTSVVFFLKINSVYALLEPMLSM